MHQQYVLYKANGATTCNNILRISEAKGLLVQNIYYILERQLILAIISPAKSNMIKTTSINKYIFIFIFI